MTERKNPRTSTPSQSPGESGDEEARKEAEEAVVPGTGDGEAADALTPNTGAQRRSAKRERPQE
ncbi:hypothetical protein ABZX75_25275 [Streptomyces sp. NPDC003038]|uniref:hypothetical protein n=1 Tax=unclassified Streptomyces TaxID=2593676 RepID=UPI0033A84404